MPHQLSADLELSGIVATKKAAGLRGRGVKLGDQSATLRFDFFQ
jgi:hypothetical protein